MHGIDVIMSKEDIVIDHTRDENEIDQYSLTT